jgi:hypothetical protein
MNDHEQDTTQEQPRTMPKYFMELDEHSIDRAISAVAKEMGWADMQEGVAHFMVATVMRAMDSAKNREPENQP